MVSRHLADLAERALGRAPALQPRLPSRFEPRASSVAPPAGSVEQEVAEPAVAVEEKVGPPHRGLLVDGANPPRTDRGRLSQPEPLDGSASEPVAVRPPPTTQDAGSPPRPPRHVGREPASAAEAAPREPSADVAAGATVEPQRRAVPPPAARPATKAQELPPAAPPVEARRETSKDNTPGSRGRERRTQGAPAPAPSRQDGWTDADRTDARRLLQPMPETDRGPTHPETSPPGPAPGPSSAPPAGDTPTAGEPSPPEGEPSVRITIGRIEVRAVTTEAPRVPQPQTRPPPMSLEEYLRGQGEGTGR